MKIVSWNVNGLRAILRKNFLSFLTTWQAEMVCLQETKTNRDLPLGLANYQEFWEHGQRPGYSGTLILLKKNLAQQVVRRQPGKFLTAEGRCVWLEFPQYHFFNLYFPNGGHQAARLDYKMAYYQEFFALITSLTPTKGVIFTGDVNTAHQEIDLARPKENSTHTGFLPQERAWLDQVVAAGFVDVWRHLHPKERGYSWWDYKTRARERNVGWRIDYFFASKKLLSRIKACQILTHVLGSDHAPIELELA